MNNDLFLSIIMERARQRAAKVEKPHWHEAKKVGGKEFNNKSKEERVDSGRNGLVTRVKTKLASIGVYGIGRDEIFSYLGTQNTKYASGDESWDSKHAHKIANGKGYHIGAKGQSKGRAFFYCAVVNNAVMNLCKKHGIKLTKAMIKKIYHAKSSNQSLDNHSAWRKPSAGARALKNKQKNNQ